MYDQIWLFGIDTSYDRGHNLSGQAYPSDRLSDSELRAISEFMDGGGGVFSTGDHGALGVCLSGAVPRIRSMRLWGNTSSSNDSNEVSMTGRRRNDTNRPGPSVGSQFNDQSDDVPQTIEPKLYRRWAWWWKTFYPHPLLCGPRGIIRVLPDHPHEGQCSTPADTSKVESVDGYSITEYPAGANGNARPLPEIVAVSTVLAGTVSDSKSPTDTHTFGAICAYDGQRANVGRVVTDATWHHFVNINFIGDPSAPANDPKRLGFLASASGQAHMEDVKTYHRNIAVWLSRASQLRCMRNRICWLLLWHHRVMEAVMTRPDVPLKEARISTLFDIGRHARDVLGLYASQCQSRQFALDLVAPHISRELLERLDPWTPLPGGRSPLEEPDRLPWADLDPILDVAVGGALLSIREHYKAADRNTKVLEAGIEQSIEDGVRAAIEMSHRSFEGSTQLMGRYLAGLGAEKGGAKRQ